MMNNRRKFIKKFAALNSLLGLNFFSAKETLANPMVENDNNGKLSANFPNSKTQSLFVEKEKVNYDKKEWERKQNREEIARIYAGKADEAIENMKLYLEKNNAGAPEIYYGLSLAYSCKKMPEPAAENFMLALNNGLEFSRFLAGPREGLKTLHETKEFEDYYKAHPIDLVHGPMIGAVSDTTAKIWLRTWQASRIKVLISPSASFDADVQVFESDISPEKDYTAIVDVTELRSNTAYYYQIEIGQTRVNSTWHFRTFPDVGKKGVFHVGFGGCAAYEPKFERIWDTIARHDMQIFMILGDNVYIDHPEQPDVQRFCYYQRESVPSFRKLTAGVPYISIWDDHDFGVNDSYGSPALDQPDWKPQVLKIFKENFANPGYGTKEQPGIWYTYQLGDVEFFMLDTRYYRQPSTDHEPSMLGTVQREWLKAQLKKSNATFKVIVSSVAWGDGAKGEMEGRIDGWAGYPKERVEIFDFLTENKIGGVIVLAADRHRHDVWKHERENDYPIYEFTSSRLTNIHYHALMPGAIFGYNEKNGFAILTFHTEAEQPYMVYQIYSIDNELINQMRIYLHLISYES